MRTLFRACRHFFVGRLSRNWLLPCFCLLSIWLCKQPLRHDVLNEKRTPAIGHCFARGFLPNGGHPLVLFRLKLVPNHCVANRRLVGLLDVTVKCSQRCSRRGLYVRRRQRRVFVRVSGNGPLRFRDYWMLSRKPFFVARKHDAGPHFPEVRGKIENRRAQPDFRQQNRRSPKLKTGVWSADLGFTPHFRNRPLEVCGKFRNP